MIWSPGHTPGTTNMIFEVRNPVDGRFYTFGYHGGYGVGNMATPTAASGWLRLSFQHGFSYLQQTQNVDFVSPQHTNQFPIVEVYQALKAYNRDPANATRQLTMMDAMRSKVFDSPDDQRRADHGRVLEPAREASLGGLLPHERHRQPVVQEHRDVRAVQAGPRRRATPRSRRRLLDGGKIVQGFVGPQNKNPLIPLLANGIVTQTDTLHQRSRRATTCRWRSR